MAAEEHGLWAAVVDVETHFGLCWSADLYGGASVWVARRPTREVGVKPKGGRWLLCALPHSKQCQPYGCLYCAIS